MQSARLLKLIHFGRSIQKINYKIGHFGLLEMSNKQQLAFVSGKLLSCPANLMAHYVCELRHSVQVQKLLDILTSLT